MPADAPKAVHSSFTIEREFAARPSLVFKAWATVEAKSRWFVAHGAESTQREMDFRVGGRDHLLTVWPAGMRSEFEAEYFDIVPNRRIVYVYEMRIDDVKISVSLATVELEEVRQGTRLTLTEQHAFLNGYEDKGSREQGTNVLLDQLGALFSASHQGRPS
jgi:uncharacterized protein YndB with AHSA1/START domain